VKFEGFFKGETESVTADDGVLVIRKYSASLYMKLRPGMPNDYFPPTNANKASLYPGW
jgi:hypothetical protein